jgi:putative transposase
MTRKPYPTDLTDAQWARIAPLIPPAKPGGRRRTVNVREVLNAITVLREDRLPVEEHPPRVPSLGNGPLLLAPLAPRRDLAEGS